ncbi:MAG: carbohydrate porin [Candidatus Tectimicrobiota bacterium]
MVRWLGVFGLWCLCVIGQAVAAADEASSAITTSPYLFGSWGGARQRWMEGGVSFDAVLTTDVVTNSRGGLRRGTLILGDLSLMATLDTEQAGLWPQGRFFAYVLGDFGGDPSDFVGDTQGISAIQATDALRMFEAWYEQQVFQNRLSLRIGLYDYNAEFYALNPGFKRS